MTAETTERLAYTPAEVAKMLALTPQTVYRLINQGELKARRVGTRNFRIAKADLDAYLAGQDADAS